MDLTSLDFEYQTALENVGKDRVYGFWGFLWKLSEHSRATKKTCSFRKKTYLLLLLLTGWFGGHRYYEKRWGLGLLYTAFFWTGIPLAMCIIDAMIVIPMKADCNGRITTAY